MIAKNLAAGFALASVLLCMSFARADEPRSSKNQGPSPELIKQLEKTLTGAKLVGQFTVEGKEQKDPKDEAYTITDARKLPDGDLWMIKARIEYGKTDKTVPIPLEIKWAGDTPVITMTNFTIPEMGTFTCRVMIYENRYAGTWQHDQVGGLLFGKIERANAKEEK